MVNNEAESIIERYLGYSITPKEYEEHVKLGKYGFELKYTPFLSLVSVQARTNKWGMPGMDLGPSVWMNVPLEHAHAFTRDTLTVLLIPPTLFGTPYTEVMVKYQAGLMEIPEELNQAIQTVTDLINKGEISQWNTQLPLEVLEILDSFRKEDK